MSEPISRLGGVCVGDGNHHHAVEIEEIDGDDDSEYWWDEFTRNGATHDESCAWISGIGARLRAAASRRRRRRVFHVVSKRDAE